MNLIPQSEFPPPNLSVTTLLCAVCGEPVSPSDEATHECGVTTVLPRAGERMNPFLPGAMVAERYRIVALLGSGGMGEVYRADDLKLEQPVALKFLPESLQNDGRALARIRHEVRLARQVAHPNVCRVFDLGETGRRVFISMEFVTGDDIASLLRRIGRLPVDKGLEVAQQLCAGLAAAHAAGVLHRDLKPANVMLDGTGQVRITDFGLSISIAENSDSMAGTPAYMAPEQLAGKPPSAASDLYALGLILCEIFTGRRAHEGLPALTDPLRYLCGLDPRIERAVLQCLATEPAQRPASADEVARSLPAAQELPAAVHPRRFGGETAHPRFTRAAWLVLRSALAGMGLLLLLSFTGETPVLSFIKKSSSSAGFYCIRGFAVAVFLALAAMAYVVQWSPAPAPLPDSSRS